MLSFRPLIAKLRDIARQPYADITTHAADRWEVAPGNEVYVPPAIFLPDQLDKIAGTEFGTKSDVLSAFRGDFTHQEKPTMGYRIKDVDLVDGVLYAPDAQRHLRPRQNKALTYRRPGESMNATMYESWIGNRWFGSWLGVDVIAYLLTETVDHPPVTTAPEIAGHTTRYEELLRITPRRVQNMHFDELILFDDFPNNAGKTARGWEMRKRLMNGRDPAPIPGVFILRGTTGDMRLLANETELAENFARDYGFKIINPMEMTVDDIVAICANAQVVAGVEGSHLEHGLAVMPAKSTLFVIQPPDRVVATLKQETDRQDRRFAMVVGDGTQDHFTADWTNIQHTMDMVGAQ